MKKVIITRLPQFKGGGAFRTFGPQTPPEDNTVTPGKGFSDNRSTPDIKVNKTLKPVPVEHANLEAEEGETVITNLNDDGLAEFYHIKGKRHSRGGTPLNLPEHSFIYSRDNAMKIKNPDIQRYFGLTENKAGYTPADISKKYNLNKYREILADPNSDKLQRKTAELMMKNYVSKLGALALVQESVKGFQEGIPSVAGPFMQKMGIDPMQIAQHSEEEEDANEMMDTDESRYGGPKYYNGGPYIGTDISMTERRRLFGDKDWWGTQGLLSNAVGIATQMGNAFNPAVTTEEIANRTLAENMAIQGIQGDRGWLLGDQVKQGFSEMDPTATTPVQFGNPLNMYGTISRFGGEKRTLKQYKKGGGVTPGDVKLKPGDQVMSVPGVGLVIINKRGEVVGSIDTPQSAVLGTEQDPNKPRTIENPVPTKSVNIPKDAVKWDPTQPGFDLAKVQEGHYIKKEDGRWYKVTGRKVAPYEGRPLEQLDERLGTLKEAYGRLEHKILSSPDLQKALIAQYRELIGQVKPKGVITPGDVESAKNITDQEIINNYLRAQQQVMMINANYPGIGQKDVKDTWDRGIDSQTGLPRQYSKAAQELGVDPLSISQTVAFQTAYIGMQNLYKDDKFKTDLQDFKPLTKTQVGLGDEGKGLAEGHSTISDVDGWWGNTTTGQAQLYQPLLKELDYELVDEVVEDPYKHLPAGDPGLVEPVGPFPEDVRNLNYATWALLNRRKGQPALVNPMYYEATPQFTDFQSPVQRQQAVAQNLAVNNPYLSGQRYGSVASQLMNPEATLQAQEMANRFNTAVANQFKQFNAPARTQFSAGVAAGMKRYLDEVEMGNEMANREFIAGVGLQNAMKNNLTKNWRNINLTNEMSDDFAINPNWDGRNINTLIVKKFNPVQIAPKNQADEISAIADAASMLKASDPTITGDKALDLATKLVTGKDFSTPAFPPAGTPSIPGMTPMYPGYINPAAYGLTPG